MGGVVTVDVDTGLQPELGNTHTTLVEKEVSKKFQKIPIISEQFQKTIKSFQNFVESDGDDGIDTHDHKKSNGFSKLGALKEEEEDQVLGAQIV